jgi:hypothetical protein
MALTAAGKELLRHKRAYRREGTGVCRLYRRDRTGNNDRTTILHNTMFAGPSDVRSTQPLPNYNYAHSTTTQYNYTPEARPREGDEVSSCCAGVVTRTVSAAARSIDGSSFGLTGASTGVVRASTSTCSIDVAHLCDDENMRQSR